MWTLSCLNILTISVLCLTTRETDAEKNGWNFDHNAQYHVQTDEGPERYFRFQTLNGQYRKEKRLVDGTVIGTEGWLDPLGYFRLKDYIADDSGFRILRSKMIYVGKDAPIYDVMKEAERVPTQTGILVQPSRPPNPFRQSEAANVDPLLNNDINSNYYVSTTTRPRVDIPSVSNSNNEYLNLNRASFHSGVRNLKNYSQLQNTYNKYLQRSNDEAYATTAGTAYDNSKTSLPLSRPISRSGSTDFLPFDGSYTTANGFQYYLKRHYHEEEQDKTGNNIGSFGYIDPFGIRRVIYYKTDPQNGGFIHRKNNRYVGFAATPYDPSPASLHRRRSRSTDK